MEPIAKIFPKVRGKYEKWGEFDYMQARAVWAARYIRDTESDPTKSGVFNYVLDERSVNFAILQSMGSVNLDEIQDCAKTLAKKYPYGSEGGSVFSRAVSANGNGRK